MKPKFIASPHHMSRKGHAIQGIVIHRMVGTYQGTIAWFENPESNVSAHYLISQEGEVTQMVRDQEAAWHAGYKSGTPPPVFRDTNPNFVSIGIECEDRTAEDTNFWTQKQLNTLVDLCKILVKQYNIPLDREHIVGHSQINPTGKPNCPGSHFPWDEFLVYLTEPEEEPVVSEDTAGLNTEILHLKEEYRVMENDLRGEIDSLKKAGLVLEKERNEARTEREGLKATLGAKQIELLKLQERIVVLSKEVAELASKRQELTAVVDDMRKSEESLRALLEKLGKEHGEEVKEVNFDTNKPLIRWLQIFLWNGLSALIPVAATYFSKDVRYLAFAPLINASAKTLLDALKKKTVEV